MIGARYSIDLVKLQQLMIEKGIKTQVELSDICGVDRNTVSGLMNRKIQPSSKVMYKLAAGLEMTPEQAGCIFFNPNLRNK